MSEVAGLVVGTAGHIDHGKTSLVRTLTGVDLDTLPEEKARGITVALGFTHLRLEDERRVSFVDVPGHERLIRTMVAGATGIDAVILCVSAVDGAMPQTREHLAILDLLGVEQGVIAVTMADLVDEDLLELAVDDIRSTVAGTFLANAEIVPFSSVTGAGRDQLVRAIAQFTVPDRAQVEAFREGAPPKAAPFRLPVDRVFVRPGFGVVVTGTAWSGTLADGDTVTLVPGGVTARVRGIEVHGARVERAVPGWRTALNLAGADPEQVHRGLVATRGPVPMAPMIDVRYRHLAGGVPIAEGEAVRVLHGTTERGARLHLAEARGAEARSEETAGEIAPGETCWVQLRLEAPLACLPGDRVIVRRSSPSITLGGGRIVDPWAVRVRRRDRAAYGAGLARLAAGERRVWLERAGEIGLSRAECAERGIELGLGVELGDRVVAPEAVDALCDALAAALADYHRDNPLARGAPRRDVRRGRLAHLGDKPFDGLLELAAGGLSSGGPTQGLVELDGPLVRARGFEVTLDAGQQRVRDAVLAALTEAGLDGRTDRQLSELGPAAVPIAHLLGADGTLIDVSGVGWVLAERLAEVRAKVEAWLGAHEALTPQDFKELTGLSRKSAIPLLEWLDRQRVTRREGDKRVAYQPTG
jgi:selenocysteine-specific elongation factor